MKRISAIAAPDRAIMDAAHGPLFHHKDGAELGLDSSYNTRRDKAEQAIIRRWETEPEFAAECAAMNFEQWEAYLDKHCGKRPGRGKWDNKWNKNRPKKTHGGARETPVPEGYIRLSEAAALAGWTRRQVDWYARSGVKRHGVRAVLKAEKIGKLCVTKPEWVEEFKRAAWWLAIDAAVKAQKETA
jgi:hypothetical protein